MPSDKRPGGQFLPEQVRAMGEAFDLALDRLSLRHDHPAAEKVALVIFALVDAGETDPNKLAEEVVLQLKRNA